MKKTIRPILRDDLSRKGLEKRIDLRVYLDGRQTKFATPYSIAPACWDKKSGRVVGNCPEKSVINGYLNGKETEYERYLFQCEMLGETVDLERIREILTGKARTAPSEKTNATLDEIFDAYVDKLRTDNRCERTIIYWTLKRIWRNFRNGVRNGRSTSSIFSLFRSIKSICGRSAGMRIIRLIRN